jgi:hypothetical protein
LHREDIMSRTPFVFLSASSLLLMAASTVAADTFTPTTPLVGEVRVVALDPRNQSELGQLRQQGWIQADGHLVSTSEFPALYRTIGRRWTSPHVASDKFALPDLDPADVQRRAENNPFGVLGPGDLVSGGQHERRAEGTASLMYFIYVGR